MKILLFLLDAFSYDYLDRKTTPFLFEQEVTPLIPVFGFKQLAAAFSGRDSLLTGLIADYYYDPKRSPFRWTSWLPRPIRLFADVFARSRLETLIKHIRVNPYVELLPHANIPIEYSRFFSVDKNPFPRDAPILQLLEEKKLSYRFIFYPSVRTNLEAFHMIVNMHKRGKLPDFLLVHFPSLDPISHIYGVDSMRREMLTRNLDIMMLKLFRTLSDEHIILAFSDHGMCRVTKIVPIPRRLWREIGDGYVFFLDSIMIRFWIFKESKYEFIIDNLEKMNGYVINCYDAKLRPFFGDVMLVCRPGHIIFPNYYDQNPPKAMHGYLTMNHEVQRARTLAGILLSNVPLGLKGSIWMYELFHIIKSFIEDM